ncbi:MAG: prephenate dehydrogenase dimerization domain-containing protein, partial [Christensenella sp.]
LCPQMWAELFLENGDALLKEIDELQKNITALKSAIAANDERALCALLQDGSDKKELLDNKQ